MWIVGPFSQRLWVVLGLLQGCAQGVPLQEKPGLFPPTVAERDAGSLPSETEPAGSSLPSSLPTTLENPTLTPSPSAPRAADGGATSPGDTQGPLEPETSTPEMPPIQSAEGEEDVTSAGTPIAYIETPGGGGSSSLEVLRDGDLPPVGMQDSPRQYDTYVYPPAARQSDWLGYTFSTEQRFTRVLFQNGGRFEDGGWFESPRIEVHTALGWQSVDDSTWEPPYPGSAVQSFESFNVTFPAVAADGIRIQGAPGGESAFISCGELRVWAEVE